MDQLPDLTKAQLFLDDRQIEETCFISRQWHQPRRFPKAVLTAQQASDTWCPTLYGSVLYWQGKFRMWYVPFAAPFTIGAGVAAPHRPRTPRAGVCYAESVDGVAWHKPKLGLFAFQGDKQNNLVLEALADERYIDDISVIVDSDDPQWPLKALFWEGAGHDWNRRDWGIYLARSQDGVHWERPADPARGPIAGSPVGLVLPQWIDRFNASSGKIAGQYVLLGRGVDVAQSMGRNGRSIWRSQSADLLHWTPGELVLQRDPDDPIYLQYYSLTAFEYESVTLGGLERMHMVPDQLDIELVWSHDGGRRWQRACRRPAFLAPSERGRHWDDTWVNLPSTPPVVCRGQLLFHYGGRSQGHDLAHPPYGAIGLAQLRRDGFASLHALEQEGIVLSKPLSWPGGELRVNADPRRNLSTHRGYCTGQVAVEVRDEQNQPLPGFTFAEVTPISGNTISAQDCRAVVQWGESGSARTLAGRRIRLAFRLRDAHLYSYCAAAGPA